MPHVFASDPRAAFFDERAVGWEAHCYPPPVRAKLAPLVASFQLPSGGLVLDMGTGPGTLLPYLRASLGTGGRIVPFDLSLAMLHQAKDKLGPDDPSPVLATAMALPFLNECFDAVVCFAAFPHFADKRQALWEMARVARPGAPVVIAHLMSRSELTEHHGTHRAVAEDRLPEDDQMRGLFHQVGLPDPCIVDAPGRYLARTLKPAAGQGVRA